MTEKQLEHPTPGNAADCENTGVAGTAIRKLMKTQAEGTWEWAKGIPAPQPRSKCVNTLNKGLRGESVAKTVDKRLTGESRLDGQTQVMANSLWRPG
jgi:hypothetical protein